MLISYLHCVIAFNIVTKLALLKHQNIFAVVKSVWHYMYLPSLDETGICSSSIT